MRRTIPAVIALALAVPIGALASPASAADASPAPATRAHDMQLSCHEIRVDAHDPAIHCAWGAVEGSARYRVVAVTRRGHHGVIGTRKTTETSFTRKDVKPGRYVFMVKALDDHGKTIDRSKRERVVVRTDHAQPKPAA